MKSMEINKFDKHTFMSQFGNNKYLCPRCKNEMHYHRGSLGEYYSCSSPEDDSHIEITFDNNMLRQVACYATKKSYIYFINNTSDSTPSYPLVYVGAGCQFIVREEIKDYSIKNIMKIERKIIAEYKAKKNKHGL